MSKFLTYVPRLWSHWITLLGTVITTLSGVAVVVALTFELVRAESNPYANLLLWVAMPGLFVLGLLLIPLGQVIARRRNPERKRDEESLQQSFGTLLRSRTVRRRLAFVAVATFANVVILAAAGHQGARYMDSPSFCGATCHVMKPQYEAWQRSPHSSVKCVECHIGPGASYALRSKIDGLKQVYALATDGYDRPIRVPPAGIRPAHDTCERCHAAATSHGNRIVFRTHYAEDEANTAAVTAVLLKVGGPSAQDGSYAGIHWHASPDVEVRYEPLDEGRARIGRIQVVQGGVVVREYLPPGGAGDAPLAQRTMDCLDCHSRPAHAFDGPAAVALDLALEQGRVSRDVPWIRQAGLAVLTAERPARDGADRALRDALAAFYAKEHPDARVEADRLERAATALADLYRRNVYPEMGVTWDTYPTHIGHPLDESENRGCFRCHDDAHVTADGKALSQDCSLCHEVLAEGVAPNDLPEALEALRPAWR